MHRLCYDGLLLFHRLRHRGLLLFHRLLDDGLLLFHHLSGAVGVCRRLLHIPILVAKPKSIGSTKEWIVLQNDHLFLFFSYEEPPSATDVHLLRISPIHIEHMENASKAFQFSRNLDEEEGFDAYAVALHDRQE